MVTVLRRWYQGLFQFVAQERVRAHDCPTSVIHAQLVAVLTTSPLMWAYAGVAVAFIADPWAPGVGIVAAIVHLLSPFLFRWTARPEGPTHLFLTAGLIHQATFSYFSGGPMSPILIWFGVLPVLAGAILGRKGLITWSIIAASVAVAAFLLLATGMSFPNRLAYAGFVLAQGLIVFGWMGIGLVVIWLYLRQGEESRDLLEAKNRKIELLNAVMTHDLLNPVAVVRQNLYQLRKTNPDDPGVSSAERAADDLADIIQRVRDYHTAIHGTTASAVDQCSARELFQALKHRFSARCAEKQLDLIHLSPRPDECFWCPRTIVEVHVLGNLIDNALKFSYRGSSVEVEIEVRDAIVRFAVNDTGAGLAPRGQTGTEGEPGSGLGLVIVQGLVELLKGTIDIVSPRSEGPRGGGTSILIHLPRLNSPSLT